MCQSLHSLHMLVYKERGLSLRFTFSILFRGRDRSSTSFGLCWIEFFWFLACGVRLHGPLYWRELWNVVWMEQCVQLRKEWLRFECAIDGTIWFLSQLLGSLTLEVLVFSVIYWTVTTMVWINVSNISSFGAFLKSSWSLHNDNIIKALKFMDRQQEKVDLKAE